MGGGSGKFHYGYLIVLTFIATSFGPLSFVLSCAGLFFTPVAESVGSNPGITSYYIVVIFVVELLTLTWLGNAINRIDARVFLSTAVILSTVSFVCQSFVTELWQYLLCAAPMGISVTILLMLAPSTFINRWFATRSGFFVGLCMAFTGVGGMVWNAVGGVLIAEFGWRTTCLVFGVLCSATALPFTLFVVRDNPASKGLLPFGAGELDGKAASQTGVPAQRDVPAREAFKTKSFLMLMLFTFLLNFGMYVYQVTASYCATLPLSAEFPLLGATAAATVMASQTIAKVIEGMVGEKHLGATLAVTFTLGLVGVALIALGGSSMTMIYAGAGSFGFYYAIANVMLPIITRRFYGIAEYSVIYARVSMAMAVSYVLSTLGWGALVSITGSYHPVFLGVCIVLACAGLCAMAAIRFNKRERSQC